MRSPFPSGNQRRTPPIGGFSHDRAGSLDKIILLCNNRFMRLTLGMFGAGFAVVVLTGLALAWDGAYQLVYILENGVVRVGYGRFTQGAIFAAVLALSQFTDHINALDRLSKVVPFFECNSPLPSSIPGASDNKFAR